MKKIFTYTMMALIAMTMFTSCDDDGYIADTLRNRNWQGYIDIYYNSRWGLSGDEYATVMLFTSNDSFYTSGRGREVDYNTRSPYKDYAYCTFKWFIVDGEITLIYDDDRWKPIYIYDYDLYSTRFRGYIDDGTNRNIYFDLVSREDYDGWGYYDTTGGYGDFVYQNHYYSREAPAEDFEYVKEMKELKVIDRTELVREATGISDAVSKASGSFAEAMENW